MRLLLLILLAISLAVAPAAARVSCAAMANDGAMAAGAATADRGDMDMSGMAGEDCESLGDESLPSHDAGCAAACALACPGFYAGPDQAASTVPVLRIAQFPIPTTDPGVATASHLDPPPPRT